VLPKVWGWESMGKKRVAFVSEKSEAKKSPKVRLAGLKGGERVVMVSGEEEIKKGREESKKEEKLEKKEGNKEEKKEEKKKKRKLKVRGKKYQKFQAMIGTQEEYSLKEAIELLKKTSVSSFAGTAEAHIVVSKVGLKTEIQFPYDIGKKRVVAIADEEKTFEKIKKGKIDFDVLLASPKMMPKLVPYAKILGPRGLMPNPKNKTVVVNPEQAAKEMRILGLEIKTEKKAPLVHTVFGRINQENQNLEENLKTLISRIGKENIKKLVICSTMGPGIRVKMEN